VFFEHPGSLGTAVTVPKPRTATDPRRWWALALVRGAFCTVILDPVIVTVALPSSSDNVEHFGLRDSRTTHIDVPFGAVDGPP
jgi:hypothetical protein